MEETWINPFRTVAPSELKDALPRNVRWFYRYRNLTILAAQCLINESAKSGNRRRYEKKPPEPVPAIVKGARKRA